MSHTIRNERTKGWLDKLAFQRRSRKVMRELKADEVIIEWDDNMIPSAENLRARSLQRMSNNNENNETEDSTKVEKEKEKQDK